MKVAMGLDILKHVNSVDDARNRLYSIIHSLEATCLLEVKASGSIQMHDFVRDFAISIARRDKLVFLRKQSDEEWPTKDFLTRCTQVVLDSCVSELPQMIDSPYIKFFCLSNKKNRSLEVPDDFFEGMGSLRVLDLTFLNLSSLPTSFRFLTDLQTLCLNFCILENMVEINALQNLVILCLLGSSMTKLPREIGQLTQLRMLDLSKSGIKVIPPNILSSLTKLEELYMGNTFVNWEDASSTVQNKNASISELQKLPNLTTLELQIRETWMLPRDMQTVFEKLERYKIAIGDVWKWSDIVNGTSKTLMLKLGTNIHLEHGIKSLIKGVENLYLDDVGGIQNVVFQLNVEGFPLLKHLHIQNNANMKYIVDSQERNQIHVFFPSLETLVLHNLKNLEHIWNKIWNYDHHSMCNLASLIVESCGGLKYLFSSTMVGSFKNLKHVEISNCLLMEEIIAKEERNNEIEEESNSHCLNNKCVGSLFPKLEVVDIEGCPLLECIFPFLFVQDVPVLQKIRIRRCDGLKYIFGQYQHVEFSSLRQLELSQLPNFIDMFCKSNNLISLSETGSSSTSNHGSMAQLQLDLDPMKYNIFSWDTTTTTIPLLDGHYSESNSYCINIWERVQCLSIPSKILYNIKKMELSQFSKIESVFIPSIAPRMLLETLTIRNCDELKNIIDFGDYESGSNNWGDVFPKMKELYIEDCPKMDYIFGHDTNDHQNHVEIQLQLQLLELKCLSLCNLPSLVAMCPKHYRIRFPPLAKLELNKCSPDAIKSMSNFKVDPVSESLDSTIRKGMEIIVEEGSTSSNANTITSSSLLVTPECKASSQDDDWDEEDWDETNIGFASQVEMLRQFNYDLPKERDLETTEDFADEVDVQATSGHWLQLGLPYQNDDDDDEITVSKSRLSSIASQLPSYGTEVQATSGHGLTSSHENDIDSNILGFETKRAQTAEGNQDSVGNVSGLKIPSIANSDVLMSGQSTSQQCLMDQLGEIDTSVISSQGIEIHVEEGTTTMNAKTITSSGPLVTSECKTASQEDGDSQIAMISFSIATTETNNQVSSNDDATMKISLIVEQQSPKKVEITVSPSSIASQCASKPSEENSSHIVEDLSYSLLVKRELEQLVFKKHLAIENLSLLTDFLVKHPSVLLRDTSLSNRYKGYAYNNCLSELLKFLQTHSVLDVLGSSHSEFVELLHDVRKCGFDKEWLDDVEKRTLFPGLQIYKDRLKKLLDSKHMLTQYVEDLKNQLASSETVLESIIQQEEQILEAQAALSDPIGY
ncbi:unnamed protein product [Trifolium pratense]|uniref:Uncharacterized protein n=1 Tax=Trifolium pratense TaxID=57577 RepID=A0ACB0J8T2_TRIPR|nr:unnamed protein product [Trifolium pratense]